MQKNRRLNLGCGKFKKEGYINVNSHAHLKPDFIYDLNEFPYPFESDSFTLIESDHNMEHLENPLMVMKELHRILENNGKLIIQVPHFSRGLTHPDHKRGFDVTFPYYFNKEFKGGYTGVDFKLDKVKLSWFAQPYLKKTVLSKPVYYLCFFIGKVLDFFANISPIICSRGWCFLVGGFEQIEFQFKAIK